MSRFKEKYIGDKAFYINALKIAIPMIVQNMITNFVSLLDNIMVGQVGTDQMNGVSIANQLYFIFNLTIFGVISGATIFGTQFYGKGDSEGQKYTFRYRLILSSIIVVIYALVFCFFKEPLINLFISNDEVETARIATLSFGEDYLVIMLISLLPFGIGQAYASVIRETGETRIPMFASFAAILVNLVFDYGLIFGKLGMPQMGVKGAAYATVLAKFIEALVCILYVHCNKKIQYAKGLYSSLYIPGKLIKSMLIKGFPLIFNEFMWSVGLALIAQCYSKRGLDVVAARNIAGTITNLVGVIYIQLGFSIGIIIGAKLGAGKLEEAKADNTKLTFFSMIISIIVALLLIPIAQLFPMLYNVSDSIKSLASFTIIIQAIAFPIWSYTNASYFTLRSGGKTGITVLFDFGFSWAIMIPLAFILAYYTNMEIHLMLIVVTYSEAVKAIAGFILVKSGMWINKIVE